MVDTVDHDDTGGRVLLLMDLDQDNPVLQIKQTILRIYNRFTEPGTTSKIKLLERDPVIFSINNGEEIYRFSISFPPQLIDVQNDLIIGIESCTVRP